MDFLVIGDRSIFYYLLLIVMFLAILQSLVIGGLFFLKQSGDRRANIFYGLLLITFGLTILHNTLKITEVYEGYPALSFLPLYFTLAFPTLLFYHVKLYLYPAYHFQWSDIKHFILPIGQFLFFMVIFLTAVEYKSELDRHFFNPFYGAMEQLFYLSTFFAYLYFSHRYIRQKRKRSHHSNEVRQVWYLDTLVSVLFLLFSIHAIFVVTDFVCYEFLNINLRAVKTFVALGILSFLALAFWLGVYGFQVLFWGRKVFGK